MTELTLLDYAEAAGLVIAVVGLAVLFGLLLRANRLIGERDEQIKDLRWKLAVQRNIPRHLRVVRDSQPEAS